MTEYIKILLSPGQAKKAGFTDVVLSSGHHVWVGEDGTFDPAAVLGNRVFNDPPFNPNYEYEAMTPEEIAEYEALLIPPNEPIDGEVNIPSIQKNLVFENGLLTAIEDTA